MFRWTYADTDSDAGETSGIDEKRFPGTERCHLRTPHRSSFHEKIFKSCFLPHAACGYPNPQRNLYQRFRAYLFSGAFWHTGTWRISRSPLSDSFFCRKQSLWHQISGHLLRLRGRLGNLRGIIRLWICRLPYEWSGFCPKCRPACLVKQEYESVHLLPDRYRHSLQGLGCSPHCCLSESIWHQQCFHCCRNLSVYCGNSR